MVVMIMRDSKLFLWIYSADLYCHLHLTPGVDLQEENFCYLPTANEVVQQIQYHHSSLCGG